ncbi:MAG: hypothetical protein ABIQ95_15960 [Bdellovibrionia bacterium]
MRNFKKPLFWTVISLVGVLHSFAFAGTIVSGTCKTNLANGVYTIVPSSSCTAVFSVALTPSDVGGTWKDTCCVTSGSNCTNGAGVPVRPATLGGVNGKVLSVGCLNPSGKFKGVQNNSTLDLATCKSLEADFDWNRGPYQLRCK